MGRREGRLPGFPRGETTRGTGIQGRAGAGNVTARARFYVRLMDSSPGEGLPGT